MSVDRMTKISAAADASGLAAHALGLLGANIVFGVLYFWGMPVLAWITGGAWQPSPVGGLILGARETMMPIDLVIGLAILAAGVWAVAAAARMLATRP